LFNCPTDIPFLLDMEKKDIVKNCIEQCKKSPDELKCISDCCYENGIDPVEGIIVATINEYDENFINSANPPLYNKQIKVKCNGV